MIRREENQNGRYAFLKNRSIDELEAMLKAAVKDIPADEEYIDALEAAILHCEQETPTGRLANVEQAWTQFCSVYLAEDDDRISLSEEMDDLHKSASNMDKPTQLTPRRIGRILLIAAVVVILITLLLPPALGYRDIFQMIGHWTNNAFYFDAAQQNGVEHAALSKDDRLKVSLEQYDVPIACAPTRFPEGMQMQDVQFFRQESGNIYYKAVFSDPEQEREIFFDLMQYVEPNSFVWEKDAGEVIEFPCGGVMHYITTNNGQIGLHWNVDLTEVAIYGDMSIEEAIVMIQSIYER